MRKLALDPSNNCLTRTATRLYWCYHLKNKKLLLHLSLTLTSAPSTWTLLKRLVKIKGVARSSTCAIIQTQFLPESVRIRQGISNWLRITSVGVHNLKWARGSRSLLLRLREWRCPNFSHLASKVHHPSALTATCFSHLRQWARSTLWRLTLPQQQKHHSRPSHPLPPKTSLFRLWT